MKKQTDQLRDPMDPPIRQINTGRSTEEIRDRLMLLSKKGKLPGFNPNEPGAICSVALHGTPFDSKMILIEDSGHVQLRVQMLRTIPSLFIAALILTVWPGLPLSDVFLSSFDWYNGIMQRIGIATWHWYIPLTLLPAPFVIRSSIRKSKLSAMESATETIEKIRSAIES